MQKFYFTDSERKQIEEIVWEYRDVRQDIEKCEKNLTNCQCLKLSIEDLKIDAHSKNSLLAALSGEVVQIEKMSSLFITQLKNIRKKEKGIIEDLKNKYGDFTGDLEDFSFETEF